jgi:hypothetical protein
MTLTLALSVALALAAAGQPSAPASSADKACAGLPAVKICDSLASGKSSGTQPLGKGKFTKEGWQVTDETSQIKYDLGAHYTKGTAEFEMKGPLKQTEKRTVFGLWPTEDASETVEQRDKEKKAAFHQVRLFEGGLMFRFSHRPSGSNLEKGTGAIAWEAPDGKGKPGSSTDGWHHVKTTWDTDGGTSRLWIDGKEVLSGTYKTKFPGFRWAFLGRDNYRPHGIGQAVPGVVFRNLKVYGVSGESKAPVATSPAAR